MTSEGLGEMFEGASADMCSVKFPLMSIGGRVEVDLVSIRRTDYRLGLQHPSQECILVLKHIRQECRLVL